MSIRIKAGHFYVLAEHPGISGFKDWTRKVESIVGADKARLNRLKVDREYLASGLGTFRLDDGHLPDYQSRFQKLKLCAGLRLIPGDQWCACANLAIALTSQAWQQARWK